MTMGAGGLWEHWQRPENAEPVDSFTVITTAANSVLAPIHDRMPVILGSDDWPAWLDPENHNRPLMESMLAPCPDERRMNTEA